MILSWVWTAMAGLSLLAAVITGTGAETAAAALTGAGAGVELTLGMAGAICLWTGLSRVMEEGGVTGALTRIFRPFLGRLFPEAGRDAAAMGYLSSNFTANLLGLGNAATPLGIAAVRRMRDISGGSEASNEMCRLIVLNTASIQLLPTTVAAVRAAAGAARPFDILPAVWLTSLCSAAAGVTAAWLMGKRRV